MYGRLAVQEFYEFKKIACIASLREGIDNAHDGLSMDDLWFDPETGMVDLGEDVRRKAYGALSIQIDQVEVSVDPYECDIIDDARHLVALDSDYAQKDNGEGLDKADTNKIRLLLAQAPEIGLHPQDVISLTDMSFKYRDQLASVYAYFSGLKADEVRDILKARLSKGEREDSERVVSLTNKAADPASCTHVYFDPQFDAIAVNVKGGDPRKLKKWRDMQMDQDRFRSFYEVNPKFVSRRTRVVQGEVVDRKSLLFPALPEVAKGVIEAVRASYHPAIIDEEVLAISRRGQPPAPRH